ncbi:S-layer homology domain-containing protein [Paenibacillus rigui]|uniref:Protein AncA n=1 Tax=Paenibacillus rigui TaxID=554312 RepID=A0A229UY27_9BACL|nr:S-layer homology domain-containing protein [Paenibacillus rigui]OXM88386.1 protein AncA [Paenibacillus rigui]
MRKIRNRWLQWLLVLGLMLPALPAKAAVQFSDVSAQANGWALNSIYLMAQNQVLTGYPDGTFRPGQTISKAEWSTMVYRLFDKYRPNLYATGLQKIDGFADVSNQHWAYKQISELYSHSFNWGVYGLSANGGLMFHPDIQLTRLQLADLLYSFFDTRLVDRRLSPNDVCSVVSNFKDIPVKLFQDKAQYEEASRSDGRYSPTGIIMMTSNDVLPTLFMGSGSSDCSFGTDGFSNAQASILASLQASGIMTSDEGGYFRPLDKVTRAEAVTILNRIYNYLYKNYWLADYSTIELESSGTGSGSGSTGGGSGSGSGSFSNNPNQTSYGGGGLGPNSGGWSNQSIVNVTDYFNDQGVITKDLQKNGEIETAVLPKEKRYLTIDLKSIEKVDLTVILDGKMAYLSQEELPKTISVEGVQIVGLRTQQRNPNPLRQSVTATLSVKLDLNEPQTTKKK